MAPLSELALPVLKAVLVANRTRSDLLFGQLKAMLPREFRARHCERLKTALEELKVLKVLEVLEPAEGTPTGEGAPEEVTPKEGAECEPSLVYKSGQLDAAAQELVDSVSFGEGEEQKLHIAAAMFIDKEYLDNLQPWFGVLMYHYASGGSSLQFVRASEMFIRVAVTAAVPEAIVAVAGGAVKCCRDRVFGDQSSVLSSIQDLFETSAEIAKTADYANSGEQFMQINVTAVEDLLASAELLICCDLMGDEAFHAKVDPIVKGLAAGEAESRGEEIARLLFVCAAQLGEALQSAGRG